MPVFDFSTGGRARVAIISDDGKRTIEQAAFDVARLYEAALDEGYMFDGAADLGQQGVALLFHRRDVPPPALVGGVNSSMEPARREDVRRRPASQRTSA